MLEEHFQKVEDEFFRLQGRLYANRMTEEEFTAALQNLMVEYDGRYWTLGSQSGKWYASDGDRWVEAQPPSAKVVPPMPTDAAPSGPIDPFMPVQARMLRCFNGHSDKVVCVALSPETRYAISGGEDGMIVLWSVEQGIVLRTLAQADRITRMVDAVGFSPDGKYALSTGSDSAIKIWDLQTGRAVRCISGHRGKIYSAVFSPDGRYVFSAGADHTVRQWDWQNGTLLHIFQGHTNEVLAVAASPNGWLLGSVGYDGTLRLWDLAVGQEVAQIALPKTYSDLLARGVAFSPGCAQVLSYSMGTEVNLWDIQTRRKVRDFVGHIGVTYAAVFSPDGRYLYTTSGTDYMDEDTRGPTGHDNVIRAWDVASGFELGRFEGHANDVTSLAVSTDGRFLLSGSEDKTVRLWQVDKTTT